MTTQTLSDLTEADKLAILEDRQHPLHEALIDQLDANADDEDAPDEAAPFGYMKDPKTGERRPKKRPGKRRTETAQAPGDDGAPVAVVPEPAVEAEPTAEARQPIERDADRAPDAGRRRGRGRSNGALVVVKPPKEDKPVPAFRAGPIARGMNKFYRKVGKILRVANPMLGQAMIDMTKKEDPDDEDELTVGEAWEEVARNNPKIRRFLMSTIGGGAWMTLIMCHGPLIAAILMLDPIQRRFPLGRVLLALMSDDDEDGQDEDGFEDGDPFAMAAQMFGGLDQTTLMQMMSFAQQTADQAGARVAGQMHRGEQAG